MPIKLDPLSLGKRQQWKDKKAERSSGATYYNTTGRAIMVSVSMSNGSSAFLFKINGQDIAYETDNVSGTFSSLTCVVPDGASYGINAGTISVWWELTDD